LKSRQDEARQYNRQYKIAQDKTSRHNAREHKKTQENTREQSTTTITIDKRVGGRAVSKKFKAIFVPMRIENHNNGAKGQPSTIIFVSSELVFVSCYGWLVLPWAIVFLGRGRRGND
jgi:hypothetical protein